MKVTMHKSSDGVLHTTMTACKQHEANIKVAKAAEGVEYDTSKLRGAFDEEGEFVSKVLYEEDIGEFVTRNAVVLRKLLNEATITRRPRKVKAAQE